MTQYTKEVALRDLKAKIEKWAKGVKSHYMQTLDGDGFYEITYNDDSIDEMHQDGTITKIESPYTFEDLVRMHEQDHGIQW